MGVLKRVNSACGLMLAALICASACAESQGRTDGRSTFVVASTTSLQDSGLLDDLIPRFEDDVPQWRAKVVAVGSGEAIDLGRKGDADVLLVHSPKQEEEFMNGGFGLLRKRAAKNDFVIAGPPSDPAEIADAADATAAFAKISQSQSFFVSRGDESGTHQRELQLWERAKIELSGGWYLESGQGMAETLSIANQKTAYVLTDTASLRVLAPKISLKVLFEGDPILFNPYSVIPVKNARQIDAANAFAAWITGPLGQRAIADFGVKEYGSSLFLPDPAAE
jgi:tungstate transport system substrate-binding protein